MTLNSLSLLCLSLLLVHTHFSLAKRGGGFSSGKGFGSKTIHTSNRGSTHTKTNSGQKINPGSSSQGGYPKHPGQPNQGGSPPQSGRPGSYPKQPGGGRYHNQYPAQGSPYGGGYGGYPGGYINQNPNNKILSPRYGGSFGYRGQGVGGGSPFSHSVQAMGMRPKDSSRGFGRSAVMAAAGGAMAGMALGYGLGRFPRPPFHFHSPQEEYYYNHYMYRKYGARPADTSDYSRDYRHSQPPETYDGYMDSCMKRTDLLPAENRKPKDKPAANTTAVTSAPHAGTGSRQPEASPVPPTSQAVSSDDDEDDDTTVSIEEIGYPALIEQVKARRCLELYMVYSEKYSKSTVERSVSDTLHGLQGFLAVVSSIIVMLLNSNMLMRLH